MEKEDLQELRAAIAEADAEIEAGQYTDYTEETLHDLFVDIKRRGREELSLPHRQPE